MNKRYLTFADIERLTTTLAKNIEASGWKPTIVVGVTRGGLLTAKMLSHWFGVPMTTLDVSLRDHTLWDQRSEKGAVLALEVLNHHNLLVVDDINDSGATGNKIKHDWGEILTQFETLHKSWPFNQIKFAVLLENETSEHKSDYWGERINKTADPSWICFPWEINRQ